MPCLYTEGGTYGTSERQTSIIASQSHYNATIHLSIPEVKLTVYLIVALPPARACLNFHFVRVQLYAWSNHGIFFFCYKLACLPCQMCEMKQRFCIRLADTTNSQVHWSI